MFVLRWKNLEFLLQYGPQKLVNIEENIFLKKSQPSPDSLPQVTVQCMFEFLVLVVKNQVNEKENERLRLVFGGSINISFNNEDEVGYFVLNIVLIQ